MNSISILYIKTNSMISLTIKRKVRIWPKRRLGLTSKLWDPSDILRLPPDRIWNTQSTPWQALQINRLSSTWEVFYTSLDIFRIRGMKDYYFWSLESMGIQIDFQDWWRLLIHRMLRKKREDQDMDLSLMSMEIQYHGVPEKHGFQQWVLWNRNWLREMKHVGKQPS